jgi:hypothetical protein
MNLLEVAQSHASVANPQAKIEAAGGVAARRYLPTFLSA